DRARKGELQIQFSIDASGKYNLLVVGPATFRSQYHHVCPGQPATDKITTTLAAIPGSVKGKWPAAAPFRVRIDDHRTDPIRDHPGLFIKRDFTGDIFPECQILGLRANPNPIPYEKDGVDVTVVATTDPDAQEVKWSGQTGSRPTYPAPNILKT